MLRHKFSYFRILAACLIAPSIGIAALTPQAAIADDDNWPHVKLAYNSPKPIFTYQQNIQLLSSINDRPTIKVFGNGHVVVHYPAYMKKAGDHEMWLSEAELSALIQKFSQNGVMEFDRKAAKQRLRDYKQARKKQGMYYEVSDALETIVDIRLDEYQANANAPRERNFHTQFRWKNLEHDAVLFKHDRNISRANDAINSLKALMKDARLKQKMPP